MAKLTQQAKDTIKWSGTLDRSTTIAAFTRHWFPDGVWRGDACGCVDDRCIGYHHGAGAECGCLDGWLDEFYRQTAPATVG